MDAPEGLAEGLLGQLNNQDFKLVEFDGFKNQAGANTFVLSSQKHSELNQLISKSISSNEVIDILGSVGLSRPNIAILSDDF
ncbi:MAG: DUF3387 domain-containing protein [Desulfotomaculaceae bacterium]|nr:DUF3387 domain-containing protein [Desulfotomaculaceae bacterium]